MPGRALRAVVGLAAVMVAGCGAAPREVAPPAPSPGGHAHAWQVKGPARWLVLDSTWIERGEDGLDRVIAGGRRMEVSGVVIARLGPPAPEVDGGAAAPRWALPGPARYVFWKGTKLYGAETFAGELRPLAALPAAPHATFDWISGTGLSFSGGALVVPTSGGPLTSLGGPVAVRAVAADARRALAVTAFGHAVLTADGGATFRDVSADLGAAVSLEVRGDEIGAVLRDGRERFVSASGAVVAAGLGHVSGPARGRRPLDDPDRFPGGSAAHAFEVAARVGVALDGGGVVVVESGFVGRLDLETRRTTSLAALDPGLARADCAAFRAADGPLLACVTEGRASVIDLAGAPRIERSFDLSGPPSLDRFSGVDGEALGYLGSCAAALDSPPSPEPIEGGESSGVARPRAAVFCVRAGRDAWIEHRLDPEDTADVVAWIPRAGGGAAALVARPGTLLDDRERITVRGGLRVVRVARAEPPLAIGPYNGEAGAPLDRALRIGADDVIEGWLSANTNGAGPTAISIDAAGHPRAWPAPPHLGPIVTAGRLALARAEDGKLWETVDAGHRWAQVESPPSAPAAHPTSCSPVGCLVGSYMRLGWSAPDEATPATAAAPATPATQVAFDGAEASLLRERSRGRRRAPARPVLRLACTFEGAPESRRIAESGGFGYAPVPVPRGRPVGLGTLGLAVLPWSGSQVMATGNVELGWIAPLDTDGKIRRATAPITQLEVNLATYHPHDLPLGWLLARDGSLATFPTDYADDHCAEQVLVRAGVARRIGGCAPSPSMAVDLGGHLVVLHVSSDALVVSTSTAATASTAPTTPIARPRAGEAGPASSLRELLRSRVGASLRGFTFGLGARGAAPVAVAVDVGGAASLAPIDPVRGTLGPEERLRPLQEATLGGDPACAPRPDDARVVLPFEGVIGLDRASLPGVTSTFGPGVAVIRWSRDRACLDAVELPVRDDRFDEGPGGRDPPGTVHKLVARWGGRGEPRARILSVSPGGEMRQRVACKGVSAER